MKTTDNQEELFTVVDENDNIIGHRTRWECHSDKNLIHRSVQVVLKDADGKLILQRRSLTKDLYPGMVTVSASGHVNKGESYELTANREMYEEIGIKTQLVFVTSFLFRGSVETEYSALFTGVLRGDPKINKSEVEELLYIMPEDISIIENELTEQAKEGGLKVLGYL